MPAVAPRRAPQASTAEPLRLRPLSGPVLSFEVVPETPPTGGTPPSGSEAHATEAAPPFSPHWRAVPELADPDADVRAEAAALRAQVAALEADLDVTRTRLQDATERADTAEATLAEVEDAAAAAAALRAHVDAAETRLSELWRTAVRDLEPSLMDLALSVAEAILAAPPTDRQREAQAQAIARAVDDLADDAPVAVRLHPIDLLHVQESGLAEALQTAHPRLRWEPESALAEGEWTATTAEAAVRHLRGPILAALRERLDLPPHP